MTVRGDADAAAPASHPYRISPSARNMDENVTPNKLPLPLPVLFPELPGAPAAFYHHRGTAGATLAEFPNPVASPNAK